MLLGFTQILILTAIFIVTSCSKDNKDVYMCPMIKMYMMQSKNLKMCEMFRTEYLNNKPICNSTLPCTNPKTMCCPSNIHVSCPDLCDKKVKLEIRAGSCSRSIIDENTRNCSHYNKAMPMCVHDQDCSVAGNKCCTVCDVKLCRPPANNDACLLPANLTSPTFKPTTSPAEYYYNITKFDGVTYRGRCQRCPDHGCGETANKFKSLNQCQTTCAKPFCELQTCVTPRGSNATAGAAQLRGQEACPFGLRFDANGCYSCACELNDPCKTCETAGCTLKKNDCGSDICPYEAVCKDVSGASMVKAFSVIVTLAMTILASYIM